MDITDAITLMVEMLQILNLNAQELEERHQTLEERCLSDQTLLRGHL